jgi:hypothetical protein
LARYAEPIMGEPEQLYENEYDGSSQQLLTAAVEEEEGATAGGRPKRVTSLQLQKLFPTLFTPRVYNPAAAGKAPNPRVQAKPMFDFDPYYLVRI